MPTFNDLDLKKWKELDDIEKFVEVTLGFNVLYEEPLLVEYFNVIVCAFVPH